VPETKKQNPTLKQQGPVLPLGIPDSSGRLHKDLAWRPWRMAEERELADKIGDKQLNMGQQVSYVLATMYTQLGPHNLSAMDFINRLLVISQMSMGDVFYAYMWLRVQALGPDLVLTLKLAQKGDVRFTADLMSTEIVTAETQEQACFNYSLTTPIAIRGKPVTAFKLGPIKWGSTEGVKSGDFANKALLKSMTMRSAIVGADSFEQITLSDADLNELTKRDFEAMHHLMDQNNIGPVMIVEDTYEGVPFKVGIDWRYDSFFAVSSE